MLKTRTGRIALTALLMLPTLALVGCAGGAAEAPASSTASAQTPTATPTPTPTPTPQNQAAEPVWPNERCQDEQLSAELVDRPDLSVAGQKGLAIVLTNVSERSCSYYGGPGVLLLGADGTNLGSRGDKMMRTEPEPEPEPGALAPGESAEVAALLTEVGTYDCTPTTATTVRVLVTSDGAGPGIEAPADLQVCGDARSDLTVGSFTPAS